MAADPLKNWEKIIEMDRLHGFLSIKYPIFSKEGKEVVC